MSAGTGPVEVVCLGILVADVLARPVDAGPERGSLALVEEIALRGGGCALNTSSALVRLGVPAAAVGKVGGDTFGDFVLDLFDERSVERTGVIRDPSLPTSATVVLVSGDGERTFLHLPGANGRVRREELDEARAISGEQEPARVAAWLRDHGVRAVALTMGPDGCYAAGDDFEGQIAAPHVHAVAGTGAGDAFAAGLLYGTLAGWGLERCARFACAAGALATTAVGAFEGIGDVEATLALAEAA